MRGEQVVTALSLHGVVIRSAMLRRGRRNGAARDDLVGRTARRAHRHGMLELAVRGSAAPLLPVAAEVEHTPA